MKTTVEEAYTLGKILPVMTASQAGVMNTGLKLLTFSSQPGVRPALRMPMRKEVRKLFFVNFLLKYRPMRITSLITFPEQDAIKNMMLNSRTAHYIFRIYSRRLERQNKATNLRTFRFCYFVVLSPTSQHRSI